jgi:hypothetical protein
MSYGDGTTGYPAGLGPAAARLVTQAVRTGFTDGLNEILIIGAVVAFAAAVLSLLLIRGRDFVPPPTAPAGPQAEPAVTEGAPTTG